MSATYYKLLLRTAHFPLSANCGPQNCGPGCCSTLSTPLNVALCVTIHLAMCIDTFIVKNVLTDVTLDKPSNYRERVYYGEAHVQPLGSSPFSHHTRNAILVRVKVRVARCYVPWKFTQRNKPLRIQSVKIYVNRPLRSVKFTQCNEPLRIRSVNIFMSKNAMNPSEAVNGHISFNGIRNTAHSILSWCVARAAAKYK